MFLKLPNVTLIGVDAWKPTTTLRAMKFAMRQVQFGAAVLVTSQPMPAHCRMGGVKNLVVNIGPERIDRERALLRLHDYFTTPFALHVEWDSLLANPFAWQDEFLDYDYIGAPWPYPGTNDPGFPVCTERNCVGNLGFALLSREFCQCVSLLTNVSDPLIRIIDAWICRRMRPELEEWGLRFAPERLAAQFSCENLVYHGQFGLHGKGTLDLNGLKVAAIDTIIPA